jgi:hypothetical protein
VDSRRHALVCAEGMAQVSLVAPWLHHQPRRPTRVRGPGRVRRRPLSRHDCFCGEAFVSTDTLDSVARDETRRPRSTDPRLLLSPGRSERLSSWRRDDWSSSNPSADGVMCDTLALAAMRHGACASGRGSSGAHDRKEGFKPICARMTRSSLRPFWRHCITRRWRHARTASTCGTQRSCDQ